MSAALHAPSPVLELAPTRAELHAHLDERLQRLAGHSVVNLSPAGQALQAFAGEHAHLLPGCGFQDGGCWALAAALHRYLIGHGVGAHLLVAGRPFHVDHVLVSVSAGGPSPLYLDGDGVGSLADLEAKLRHLELLPSVGLSPLDERLARAAGLSDFAELGVVDALEGALHGHFGPHLARHVRHWPAPQALAAGAEPRP